MNVGIHNRRDAMEFQSIGKYIIKSPIYQAKKFSNDLEQNETLCEIKKCFFHHWALKESPAEFRVELNVNNTFF